MAVDHISSLKAMIWEEAKDKFCKGIYAGCCIVPNAPCRPCQRIAQGKSSVEKEMALKQRRVGDDASEPIGNH